MFHYNRFTVDQLDLYLKSLHLKPNTTYELSLDVYGGAINIFISSYGVTDGSGSHYVESNTAWTHYVFPFTTTNDPALSLFANWGISFVKKPGEVIPTDSEDTYVDNVQLTPRGLPDVQLIPGGDFEHAKNSNIYTPHWNGEVLGASGTMHGVDIVQDPLDRNNRCLFLPRITAHTGYSEQKLWKVNYFAWFKNSEQDISVHNYRPISSHQLLFIGHGEATLEVNDRLYHIGSKSLLYLPPRMLYHCTFHKGRGTVYHRIEFTGGNDTELLRQIGLSDLTIRQIPDVASLTAHIDAMQAPSPQSATYFYAVSGHLQLLLAELEYQLLLATPRQKHRAEIEKIAARLREEPSLPMSTAEMAASCSLSECYFITLFKRYIGQTPQQYRLHELMNKACSLLLDTTMSIQEIAYALGMDDPLYFSRLFRSIQGIAPRDYRKHRRL